MIRRWYLWLASLPLRIKIGLGLLAGGLIVSLLAVLAFVQYNNAVQPAANVLIEALARERAEMINTLALNYTGVLDTLSENAFLQPIYESVSSSAGSQPESDAIQRVVEEYREMQVAHPTIRNVRFVSREGVVKIAAQQPADINDSDEPYFRALTDIPENQASRYIGEIVGNPPQLTIAIPVIAQNRRLGYLALEIDPAGTADPGAPSIYRTLRSFNFVGGTISFYMLDTVAAKIESPFRVPVAMTPELDRSALSLIGLVNAPPTDALSPITGRTARSFVAGAARLNRVVVAELQPLGEAGQASGVVQFGLGLFGIWLFAMLALLILWLFSEATIVRPLTRLGIRAARAAQGQTVATAELPEQRDEVGNLWASFNTLTTMMQHDIQSLEARIAQRTRDIEATREIGQSVSSIRDLEPLLYRVIDLIREQFESIYHAQVFLIDPTGQFAVLRASTGEVGKQLLARSHRLVVGSQSVIGKTTADGQAVVALDISTSPIHRRNELLPETRAELALPLRAREGIIGALDLQSMEADAFSEGDIRLFQSIADQLATAIVNARLFEESRQRVAEIEELNRRLMGQAWHDYTATRRRALVMRDEQDSMDDWSDLQLRAYQTGKIAERVERDTVRFAVPVGLRGYVFGAVEWTVPRSVYSENTRLLAQELTSRLAVSADNTRLLEQSQRMAERERLVNEITRKLTQQTDVNQVLQVAVQELGQVLRTPQTSIRLTGKAAASQESSAEENPPDSRDPDGQSDG